MIGVCRSANGGLWCNANSMKNIAATNEDMTVNMVPVGQIVVCSSFWGGNDAGGETMVVRDKGVIATCGSQRLADAIPEPKSPSPTDTTRMAQTKICPDVRSGRVWGPSG